MPFYRVRDVAIYAEVGGDGPRLLVLGGSGADLRGARHDDAFAGDFEMLALDQRGLGRTTKPDHPYGMTDYAEDAAGLLDAVGWDACAVIGVSFGGMVAQELAIRFPERVTRAAFCCSSAGGAGGASYPIEEYFDLPPEEASRRNLRVQDTRRDEAWQAAHPEQVRTAIGAREARLGGWEEDPESRMGFRRQLAARAAHDVYDRLPLLTMPVFIAGGTYDGQAPPANQQALRRQIPQATLEFFEGGHGFLREDPRAIPRIIEWLRAASD